MRLQSLNLLIPFNGPTEITGTALFVQLNNAIQTHLKDHGYHLPGARFPIRDPDHPRLDEVSWKFLYHKRSKVGTHYKLLSEATIVNPHSFTMDVLRKPPFGSGTRHPKLPNGSKNQIVIYLGVSPSIVYDAHSMDSNVAPRLANLLSPIPDNPKICDELRYDHAQRDENTYHRCFARRVLAGYHHDDHAAQDWEFTCFENRVCEVPCDPVTRMPIMERRMNESNRTPTNTAVSYIDS
jgi:hypothetical protein